jgi:hypothetical protein
MIIMRSYDEIKEDFIVMSHMSCKPTMSKPRPNDVIDEDMSVRWNREEVERRIKAYDEEVAKLNKEKNSFRDKLIKEVYETIKKDIKGISTNDAKRIWEYAYATEDDWVSIFATIEDLVEIVDSIVNKKNDTRETNRRK